MAKLFIIPRRAGDLPPDEIVLAGPKPVDKDKIGKLPRHHRHEADIFEPRSRQHEKWFRALCDVVGEGTGRHPGRLYSFFKKECGLIEHVYDTPTGIEYELTSATKMSEAKYKELTDFAVELIFRDLLPGVERASVFAEVSKMVGFERPR